MHPLRLKKAIVLGVAALAIAASSAAIALAVATPTEKVLVDTFGNVRLRIVESDFAPTADTPNFDSGWHTHPGPAIVQVKSGSFQITQVGCTPVTVGAGQTYIEIPNTPIRAVSQGAIKWTTTLLLWNTAGSGTADPPARTNVASPCG